ncbi:MAG: PAS domain S-box protein, partial [Syntrophobacteraceae bacterium]|nr:PAS domain S-box protein [Syntrophobacteraceae bacterium]
SASDAFNQESCGIHQYYLGEMGRTFEVRSFPIKTRYGVGKLGKFKDITRTKMLKRKVRHLAVRHQAILDAANLADIGIFRLETHEGIEARFRCANIAFCRITGYAAEELLNMSYLDLIPPESRVGVLDLYRRRQMGEIPNESYERKMVRKDGEIIRVNISVAAIQTTSGRIATIGFLQDVTEREKYQKSLWLSQRLSSIGRVAAEVAHEINNPLTSVLTFNKLVERIIQQDPFPVQRTAELRDYTRYLNAEATRCAEIARNLLEFSRHNEIEVKKEHHIHEIIDKTLNILRHRAALTDIRIVTSYAEDAPSVLCDFKRLQQAFVNILWNGIEAMPEGGVLSVTTTYEPQDRSVYVVIGDTGVGVPEEHLDNIFEPFYTTKAEGKGVGLGLSVAYGIIRQHQGQIHVQSLVGKGTQFTIQLPADTSSVSEAAG